MTALHQFSVTYTWRRRSRHGPSRHFTESVTFQAADMTEVYRLAQREGERRYPRCDWRVLGCVELAPSASMSASEVAHD
jgi:hypothetical protein